MHRALSISGFDAAGAERRIAARKIAEQLLHDWDSGTNVNDVALCDSRSDLMPELAEEIQSARSIRLAFLSARLASEAQPPLTILTEEQLESPIEVEADADGQPQSAPPLVISGYQLDHELGHGGQASVYQAIQESTGRKVAVKVFHGAADASSSHRARFAREVEVLASLSHPNLVGIIDRGRAGNGSFFFVMELVAGRHLDEHLMSLDVRTSKDAQRIINLFIKICRGVDAAHQQNVVHRDLKPSNIRIDRHGEPKVFDFGLARQLAEVTPVTLCGQVLGSLPWTSPEQAAGQADVKAATDVYALGSLLYHAIAGKPPYEVSGSLHAVLSNIKEAVPSPPTKVRRHRFSRPGRLDAIVLKALAKEPSRRYASAGLLADDLQRLLVGEKTVAKPSKKAWKYALAACVLPVFGFVFVPAAPKPPVVFDLPSLTNSIGMRMVRIPAGTHHRPTKTASGMTDASFQIKPFFMATTEVTQGQYVAIMHSNPTLPPWSSDQLPVASMTFQEAKAFCQRLSEKEHHHYRLPTREEWEYACRDGVASKLSAQALDRIAWHSQNSGKQPHRVGQKWPNSWGLYDMRGGVAELCDAIAPNNGVTPGRAGTYRVDDPSAPRLVLGGSFLMPPDYSSQPLTRDDYAIGRRSDVGFRVVRDAE